MHERLSHNNFTRQENSNLIVSLKQKLEQDVLVLVPLRFISPPAHFLDALRRALHVPQHQRLHRMPYNFRRHPRRRASMHTSKSIDIGLEWRLLQAIIFTYPIRQHLDSEAADVVIDPCARGRGEQRHFWPK